MVSITKNQVEPIKDIYNHDDEIAEALTNNKDIYQSLRKKVANAAKSKEGKDNKFLDYLLAAPDLFHLLTKLMLDPVVDAKCKIILGSTIAYFVAPVDLIPDFVPALGILDDVAITAFALNAIINLGCKEEVLIKHWAGNNQDILTLISQIVKAADEMVGSGIVKKIKKYIGLNKINQNIEST